VWGSVVAVALILLAGIMTAVILVSNRLRQPERQVVIQQVPVERPADVASTSRSPVESAQASPNRTASGTANDKQQRMPVRIVEKPVKVIEKQVKVIERQIRVVEKPVQGPAVAPSAEGPAATDTVPGAPSGTFRATGLPNQLAYSGARWNATDLVRGMPSDLLVADRSAAGWKVYHDQNARPPYPHVYLKVSRRDDQYVRYVPTNP